MAQITPDLLDAFACVLEYTQYFTLGGFVWHRLRLGRVSALAFQDIAERWAERESSEFRAACDADLFGVSS